MNKLAELQVLSGIRDLLHGPQAPPWMCEVVATGVGPKLVAGARTHALAIHCLVQRKRPDAELSAAARIPPLFAGHPTDVVDTHSSALSMSGPPALPALPPPVGCGYGLPLLTESGSWGTASCVGSTAAGQAILVTSAHVVGMDEAVYDGGSNPPRRLGSCSGRLPSASRQELYGQRGSAPQGQHLVDVAVITLDPEVGEVGTKNALLSESHIGLPDGDTARIDEWLFSSLPLLSWGAASQVWRRGAVVFYWPRRTQDSLYGLCLVQQDPLSEPGDSGSLWLAYLDGHFKAVGLHWGLSTDRKSVMSFVTDGMAGLLRLGVQKISL